MAIGIQPTKRRRLSPPDEASVQKKAGFSNAFASQAASWNLEQAYERRDRKGKKPKKENTRLPIKTAEGRVQQVEAPAEDSEVDYDEVQAEPFKIQPVQQDEPELPLEVRIINAKENLAKIAERLNEDPEENAGLFKQLTRIAQDPELQIKHLALLAQLSIYTDLIPGYRIRPMTDDQLKVKVSKDVRKTRDFEQALVLGYRQYVESLGRLSKPSKDEGTASLEHVAISCATRLLTSVPHFNFRNMLLQTVIERLFATKEEDQTFTPCIRALEAFFGDDDTGQSSLDAIQIISRSLQAKDYLFAPPPLLRTFSSLRLLTELPYRASANGVDRTPDAPRRRLKKKDREFRTKRTRKALKEQKAVDKEMREADATVSTEARDKCQAETLKLVFGIFLRIVKAGNEQLMPVVLEGLGKFAHLINQDFFGDLLEVLKELMGKGMPVMMEGEEGANHEEEDRLLMPILCIKTAFALLRGQSAPGPGANTLTDLPLDLSHFTDALYTLIEPASLSPDLESSRMYGAPNTASNPLAPYLLTSLTPLLLQPPRLAPPAAMLQRFFKTLMGAELQAPEKTADNMMKLLTAVMRMHKPRLMGLWDPEERVVVSVNQPGQMPLGLAWEGDLLRKHWHPDVRTGWAEVEKLALKTR